MNYSIVYKEITHYSMAKTLHYIWWKINAFIKNKASIIIIIQLYQIID